ncbi:hypothetical protein [Phenylobacterium hankyongense]|uniref:hypothetical protein n=1 Tax=Phenylobacterium hankyongense TaxID=1813876 RepID=UPI0014037E8B|nr:hypothetical protein [Phenylobacterium hankyongense]
MKPASGSTASPAPAGVVWLNQAKAMPFGPNEVFAALSLDFEDGLSAAEVARKAST